MTPIREASYRVYIINSGNYFNWQAETDDNICLEFTFLCDKEYKTAKKAIAAWKEFCEINGITKWEVVE